MDGRYPSDFPHIWEYPRRKGKIKSTTRGSAKIGIPAFKKKPEILSRQCPCEALDMRTDVMTCSDPVGVSKKVAFVGLM